MSQAIYPRPEHHPSMGVGSNEAVFIDIPDMWEFTVKYGQITDPGKFEGEAPYVPYFWSLYLNDFADSDDGHILKFNVTKEDKALFPGLLNRRRVISLYESSDGFVCEV